MRKKVRFASTVRIGAILCLGVLCAIGATPPDDVAGNLTLNAAESFLVNARTAPWPEGLHPVLLIAMPLALGICARPGKALGVVCFGVYLGASTGYAIGLGIQPTEPASQLKEGMHLLPAALIGLFYPLLTWLSAVGALWVSERKDKALSDPS